MSSFIPDNALLRRRGCLGEVFWDNTLLSVTNNMQGIKIALQPALSPSLTLPLPLWFTIRLFKWRARLEVLKPCVIVLFWHAILLQEHQWWRSLHGMQMILRTEAVPGWCTVCWTERASLPWTDRLVRADSWNDQTESKMMCILCIACSNTYILYITCGNTCILQVLLVVLYV